MKKLLFILLVLSGAAFGQSTIPCITGPFTLTTNLSLPLPFYNQCNYGTQGYNVGMSRLDALFPGGVLSQSHGGTGTTTPVTSVFGMTGAIANLSGDVSTSGSSVTTLSTVNPNVGSFTAPNITVDAKGRITAAASGSGIGNLTGPITSVAAATSVAPAGPITQKPDPSVGIRYAAPLCEGGVACSDSNDGLSWGTAKLTVDAALEALPGGSATAPLTAGTGTLFVADNTKINSDSTVGLWIMGFGDPNYSSPPAGWLRQTNAITIECGGTQHPLNSNSGAGCSLLGAGGLADRNHPAIWLSATQPSLNFNGLLFTSYALAAKLGVCSNNTGDCGVVNIHFTASSFFPDINLAQSTGMFIGGTSFQIWFDHCEWFGSAFYGGGDPDDDLSQALLVDSTGGTGVFLITIRDSIVVTGSIKIKNPTHLVNDFFISGLVAEQVPGSAVVWFVNGSTNARVEYVLAADGVNPNTAAVQNDAIGPNGGLWAANNYGPLKGPMIVNGGYIPQPLDNSSPSANRQVGFAGAKVSAQVDDSRRAGLPSIVKYANLDPAVPTVQGSSVVTTGVTDILGGTAAATVSTVAGGNQVANYIFNSITPTVGDYYISGAWLKPINPGHIGSLTLGLSGSGTLAQLSNCLPPWTSDGDWQWVACVYKITAASGSTFIYNQAQVDSTSATTFFGPMLLFIPSGTLSKNEVFEIARSMEPYSSACVVGTICGLPGQKLVESSFGVAGSTSGLATIVAPAAAGTPTLTLPTTSGTISETVCSGTVALGTSAIGSGAAATTVTQACSGLLTTDNITLDFNASPLAVTGYTPSASGMLTIIKWPTSGQINVSVVNNTGGSITPGAITLNYRVVR